MERLDVLRPKKRIIDKILELGLVQDRRELRKKGKPNKSNPSKRYELVVRFACNLTLPIFLYEILITGNADVRDFSDDDSDESSDSDEDDNEHVANVVKTPTVHCLVSSEVLSNAKIVLDSGS